MDFLRKGLFAPIKDRDGAMALARDCGAAFLVVAAIQAALAYWTGLSILIDATVYAVCGCFIRFRQSRVAAVIAMLLGLAALGVTILNLIGRTRSGGTNIVLAVIVFISGLRAMEATFKLKGRFSDAPGGQGA
jgi:hypothetical protein